MLKAYLDDSGTHNGSTVIAVGGFVAKVEEWDAVPSPFAPMCPSFITTLISMFSR